jgi:hypothetical protein
MQCYGAFAERDASFFVVQMWESDIITFALNMNIFAAITSVFDPHSKLRYVEFKL